MSNLESAKRRILDWNLKSEYVLMAYKKDDRWNSNFTHDELKELYATLSRLRCTSVSERWKKYEIIDILLKERDYMMMKLREVNINPTTDFERARQYFVENPIPLFHKKGLREALELSEEFLRHSMSHTADAVAHDDERVSSLTRELNETKKQLSELKGTYEHWNNEILRLRKLEKETTTVATSDKEAIKKLQVELDVARERLAYIDELEEQNTLLQKSYEECQSNKRALVHLIVSLFSHVNLEGFLKLERNSDGSFKRDINDTHSNLSKEEVTRLHQQLMDNIGNSKQMELQPIDDILHMITTVTSHS
jgi:chromosome segregation ATPase